MWKSKKVTPILLTVIAAGLGVIPGLARARSGTVTVQAGSKLGCPPPLPAEARGSAATTVSGGLWVSVDGSLARIGAGGTAVRLRLDQGAGVVRHVAVRPGSPGGVAYVRHGRSRDAVVTVTASGVRVIHERGEALHPAWSPRGDLAWSTRRAIRILDAGSGRISTVAAPRRGASVYTPVFSTAHRLVVSVAPAARGWTADGDRVNDLWTYDVAETRWRRLTRFPAVGDRWTAIRTPVRVVPGVIEFVRVRADATRTVEPGFELWRLRDGRARMVHRLPGERYLAGHDASGRRLWNVPDPSGSRFDLALADPRGALSVVGCGAILVDPVDVPDPARRGRGELIPARGTWPGLDDEGETGDDGGDDEDENYDEHEEIPEVPTAIVVGDFGKRHKALDAAALIRGAYGDDAPVEVVSGAEAPMLVEEGHYGAVLWLADDEDPLAAIEGFRRRLPGYVESSWVMTP